MKKVSTYLTLMMVLLALVGCGKKQSVEFWMAYDPVDSHAFPSDTSTVVQHLSSSGTLTKVVERDSTEQWGCYVISKKIFKKKKVAWFPLDKMVYCGTESPDEKLETYIVLPESLELYNHPVGDKKDRQSVQLSKNDTVQVTARSFSWVHIRKINYSRTRHQSNLYGWVLESKLQRIEDLTYKEIDEVEAAKAVKKDAAKMEEKYSTLMAKVHPIYRKASIWLGWVALGMIAIFLAPALSRSKFWHLMLLLPISVLLIATGEECIMPSWFMMIVIPFMAYIICYPLLYFRTALSFKWIYWSVSLIASGFYLFLYLNIMSKSGGSMALRILLLVAMLFGVFLISALIYRGLDKDICPYCGFFARHSKGPRRVTGTSVSHGSGTERVYDGQTSEIRGNTKYITNHYHDEHYQTETTTTHYETDRKCMRCGRAFVNLRSSSTTRRV